MKLLKADTPYESDHLVDPDDKLADKLTAEGKAKRYLADSQPVSTVKVALVTSAYTPNIDTHENFSDITNEVSGTGYTAGGATLASKTVTQDNTNDRSVFHAADLTWSSSTITALGAIIYKDTGTATRCYYPISSGPTTRLRRGGPSASSTR